MATITRPGEGKRRIIEKPVDPFAGLPVMSNEMANSLTTGAALTVRELTFCMEHYRDLADRLTKSGPHFATARTLAIQMANTAIRRINDAKDAERLQRQYAEYQHIREIER